MESYWHYSVWKKFNEKVYKKTLTNLDLKSKRFYLETFSKVEDDNTVYEQNVFEKVYKFEKDGNVYLLPERFINKLPCNPTAYIEGYYKDSDKTIHRLVLDVDSAKITPKRIVSVKKFIDYVWNPISHSDNRTKAFLGMITVASAWKPTKICLCSEPGTGKSSGFTISKYITNDVVKIENPSKAKLQTLFCFYNQVIIEEITNVTKAQWKDVESMVLLVSDDSPDLEKHSLSQTAGMNNMDIAQLSLIFPYNRVCDVRSVNRKNKFFEEVLNNPVAFKRRFLQLLVGGKVLDKPRKPGVKDSELLLDEHFLVMKGVARQFTHLALNLDDEFNLWKRNVVIDYIDVQQETNFEGVVDVVDSYCESQDEFDDWCVWINERIRDYRVMVNGAERFIVEEEDVV